MIASAGVANVLMRVDWQRIRNTSTAALPTWVVVRVLSVAQRCAWESPALYCGYFFLFQHIDVSHGHVFHHGLNSKSYLRARREVKVCLLQWLGVSNALPNLKHSSG